MSKDKRSRVSGEESGVYCFNCIDNQQHRRCIVLRSIICATEMFGFHRRVKRLLSTLFVRISSPHANTAVGLLVDNSSCKHVLSNGSFRTIDFLR